jgi:WD40 repeat protein/serine/threonine protein kinase
VTTTERATVPVSRGKPAPIKPGTEVDHFRIVRLVGHGASGEVYLARDIQLGRKVALKLVRASTFQSEEARNRFLFEAKTTARFNHPHIVTIYAAGQTGDSLYLALEYVPGDSLRQRLENNPPSIRAGLRILHAVASALAEAHRHRVLHRDLKPENILIPKDGRVRVVDFGLAKAMSGAMPESPPNAKGSLVDLPSAPTIFVSAAAGLRGTPAYMAPEQWRMEEPTPAIDIWALGTIAFELVEGRWPFAGTHLGDLAKTICSPLPAERAKERVDVPRSLVDLITSCLDKQPHNRPSAEELVEQLDGLIAPNQTRTVQQTVPFRGLLPFAEEHADFFFGRDQEIAAFVERLRIEPVLPIIGTSGVGKSSFVQAGVVPRLKEEAYWRVIQIRPGSDPFKTLAQRLRALAANSATFAPTIPEQAAAEPPGPMDAREENDAISLAHGGVTPPSAEDLAGNPRTFSLYLRRIADETGARLLFFVDQLEELYTLVDDETTRLAFMHLICTAADDRDDPFRVVFTLRDDFLGRLARGAEVREALSHVTVLQPPEPKALGEILTKPVAVLGYSYDDPHLPLEIVDAVRNEPACLPLLQFTSARLWEHRDQHQRLILREAYRQMGGIGGALARHAEGVLSGLSPRGVASAREIMLHLVTAEGTRQATGRREIVAGRDPEAEDVLDRLIAGRLVIIRKATDQDHDDAVLELAHESLIRTWDRLARWLDESREELRHLAELQQAADLWRKRGEKADEAWQEDPLADATRFIERCGRPVPDLVRRFLSAGSKRQQARRRRRRILVTLAIVVLAAAAVIFAQKERQATRAMEVANRERTVAEGRRAEALREGAKAALARGDLLEARAKLRSSLERLDDPATRVLWQRINRDPRLFERKLGGEVTAIAFLPDGRTALVARAKEIIRLEIYSGAVRTLFSLGHPVVDMALSPDGTRLAVATYQSNVQVYDLPSKRMFEVPAYQPYAIAFSPDSKFLATAGSAGSQDQVAIWELQTRRLVRSLKGHKGLALALDFSPNGKLLASAGADRLVRIWDWKTGELIRQLEGHRATILRLRFSPDGKTLASAGGRADPTIYLWNPESGALTARLEGQHGLVLRLAFRSTGRPELISAGSDQKVRVWDIARAAQIASFSGHTHWIVGLALSPTEPLLASGSADGSIRLWDLRAEVVSPPRASHQVTVQTVEFSRDGLSLLTSGDPNLLLWNTMTGQVTQHFTGHHDRTRAATFFPDGQNILSGGSDNTLRAWRRQVGGQTGLFLGHRQRVNTVAVSPDGKTLASGAQDNRILIWNRDGSVRMELKGHKADHVMNLKFSPNGQLLAAASAAKLAYVWAMPAGTLAAILEGHTGIIRGLAFFADGKRIATGSDDHTLRLWSLPELGKASPTRVVEKKKIGLGARVYRISVASDGTIAAPLSDGTVRILDQQLQPRHTLRGHEGEANAAAFDHQTGDRVATASDDLSLRLWDSRSGFPLWRAPFLGHKPIERWTQRGWQQAPAGAWKPINSKRRWRARLAARGHLAAQSPKGELICLQHFDGTLQLWQRERDQLLWERKLSLATRLIALDGACTLIVDNKLLVVDRQQGVARTVASDVSAMANQGSDLLLATGTDILRLDGLGQRKSSYPGAPAVSALALFRDHLALGYRDGAIDLFPVAHQTTKKSFAFEGVPARAVTRIIAGPPGTLVAGYSNGFTGIWSTSNGALLDSVQLHGAIAHLLYQDNVLHILSALGQGHVIDLTLFGLSYCQLLDQVWRRVPVIWEQGVPTVKGPAAEHACARQRAAR